MKISQLSPTTHDAYMETQYGGQNDTQFYNVVRGIIFHGTILNVISPFQQLELELKTLNNRFGRSPRTKTILKKNWSLKVVFIKMASRAWCCVAKCNGGSSLQDTVIGLNVGSFMPNLCYFRKLSV